MEEYSIFDYSILQDMLINAWKNIKWVKAFWNIVAWAYFEIFSYIVVLLLIIWLVSLFVLIFKRHFPKMSKEMIKNILIERWQINKKIYRFFLYIFLWMILLVCSRLFVSIIFYLLPSPASYEISYQGAPEERPRFLWTLAIQALLFFIMAPCFIWFSFGNKFVRNIWILMYIIWISVIFLWYLSHLWFYFPTDM